MCGLVIHRVVMTNPHIAFLFCKQNNDVTRLVVIRENLTNKAHA